MARRTIFENFEIGVAGMQQPDGALIKVIEFTDPDSKETYAFPLDEQAAQGIANALTGTRIERASAAELAKLPKMPKG